MAKIYLYTDSYTDFLIKSGRIIVSLPCFAGERNKLYAFILRICVKFFLLVFPRPRRGEDRKNIPPLTAGDNKIS